MAKPRFPGNRKTDGHVVLLSSPELCEHFGCTVDALEGILEDKGVSFHRDGVGVLYSSFRVAGDGEVSPG